MARDTGEATIYGGVVVSDIIIADLVLSYLGRSSVTLKGDVPGHEFHGNQYSGGGGGGESDGGDSGGSSGSNESWRTGTGRAKSAVKVNGHPVRGKMTAEHVAHEIDKPSGLTMSHSAGSFNFYRHSSGGVAVRGRGNELTDEQHIADVINNRTGF